MRHGRAAPIVPHWSGLNVGVGQGNPAIRDAQGVDESSQERGLTLVVSHDPEDEGDFVSTVRATRRSMARFLRALHASGHGTTMWPDGFVSRLAHADAVTARFLAEPGRVDLLSVHSATQSLRTIELYVTSTLTRRERAQLRAYELAIRVDSDSLEHPLLRPDASPEDTVPTVEASGFGRPCSLRSGLSRLNDDELHCVATRLGLLHAGEFITSRDDRHGIEQDIGRLLRDDHLLGILVATLPRETLALLAQLVRERASADAFEAWAEPREVAAAVGEGPRAMSASSTLRNCGLAYVSPQEGYDRLWVPVELRHRVNGVLRALGV